MSTSAFVNRGIWNDADFRTLSRGAQHLYFMLMTHPSLSYVGVVDWRPPRLTPYTADLDVERILEAAAELSAGLYIVIDEETEEVLIRSWIKHDGVLKHPKLKVSMVKAYASTASNLLRGVIVHELGKQRAEHPEFSCWKDDRVLDVLDQPQSDPRQLGEPSPAVSPAVSQNPRLEVSPGLDLPPSPAPAPSSSTKKNSPSRSAKGTSPKGFDDWWEHWRKKKSIGDARKAFPKALKKIPLDELIAKTDAWWAWADRTGLEEQYVPYPATWLNHERWADDITDGGAKPFNIEDWKG